MHPICRSFRYFELDWMYVQRQRLHSVPVNLDSTLLHILYQYCNPALVITSRRIDQDSEELSSRSFNHLKLLRLIRIAWKLVAPQCWFCEEVQASRRVPTISCYIPIPWKMATMRYSLRSSSTSLTRPDVVVFYYSSAVQNTIADWTDDPSC